jgi:hypothetical protein
VMRRKHDRTYDCVQARSVTPAGGDGNAHLLRTRFQLLNSLEHFAWFCMSAGLFLREHQLPVHGDVENAT